MVNEDKNEEQWAERLRVEEYMMASVRYIDGAIDGYQRILCGDCPARFSVPEARCDRCYPD